MNLDDIATELQVKFSDPPLIIEGGNSLVLQAKSLSGDTYAVKKYKGSLKRIERTLIREEASLFFLSKHKVLNIPQIICTNRKLGLIVYSWIDGTQANSELRSMQAILEMCEKLYTIYSRDSHFEDAIDAAFSLSDIERQVIHRLKSLDASTSTQFKSLACIGLRDRLSSYKSLLPRNLILSGQIFSMSDLGTHNMLHDANKFYFLDFEFFGRDSIDKMIGDFLLHPRNDFDEPLIEQFLAFFISHLNWKVENLEFLLPFLSLKWATIAFSREFRDNTHTLNEKSLHSATCNSIGFKYLRYFDHLISGSTIKYSETFSRFSDKVECCNDDKN
jgi:hypothetical protein